ncbi:MAG: hypothetical protein LBT13_08300 [Treponema sp.]|nr:hypothetical protein [Treponema sp.]
MKKLAAVCIIGLVLGTAGVFAEDQKSDGGGSGIFTKDQHPDGWGIGIQGGFGMGGGGAALSLKIPALPIFWAVRLNFGGSSREGHESHFGIGVSGDYYFIDKAILPDIGLGWYLGAGAYIGYWNNTWHGWGGNDDWSYSLLQIGVEVPVGLSWMIPIPVKLELYLQAVPNIGAQFAVAGSDYYDDGAFWFSIGGNLGIRIWF